MSCLYGSLPSSPKIRFHNDHCIFVSKFWGHVQKKQREAPSVCQKQVFWQSMFSLLAWLFSPLIHLCDWLTCFMFTCTDRPSATSELSLYIFPSAPAAFQRHRSGLRIKAEEQSSHCFHRHEVDCLGWKWFTVAVKKKKVKNELKQKQAENKVYAEMF